MSDHDDLEQELITIDDELETIEVQLSHLLDRQNSLTDRASEIRHLLAGSNNKAGTSGRKGATGDSASVDLTQFENEDYEWSARLAETRRGVFRIEALRPLQLAVMNATMSGHDAMLIMPTGGGKSLCYQLPALVSEGITLVVSPLVSLMQDQLMALNDLNIPAAMLNATSDKEEVKMVYDSMLDKRAPLKLLYVTPEKLAKAKRFMAKLEKMYSMGRLARIAIDEVHCCSQWGHDFRTDYKILGILRRQFPNTPILGLTATATQRVLDDVKKILQLPKCLHFKASFNRANLFYELMPKPSSQKEMIDELHRLIEKRFKNQSGIVYCFSRNETENVSRDLRSRGIKAACYHAYVEPQFRQKVHRDWMAGRVQVIVATVAFGMGIDKPNVRFVIHHSMSKSMENYYQESGRAGRDDQPASCIVYFRLADLFRQSTMVFTEQTGLENAYKMLQYCLDTTRCRRALIARHFGERWDQADCAMKCDHCANRERLEIEEKNVVKEFAEVARVIKAKSTKEKRLTGLEVGKLCRQEKGLLCRLGVLSTERVVGQMLVDGYLREEFHFTPYNTISYVVIGPRASALGNPETARPIRMKFTKVICTDMTSPNVERKNGRKTKAKAGQNAYISKSTATGVLTKSKKSDSNHIDLKELEQSEPIVIDLDDFEEFEDLGAIAAPPRGKTPAESRSSTKRKETKKTLLESDAKKIRLETAATTEGADVVDGKKRSERRRGSVSQPPSSSDEEPETAELVPPRRCPRRRRRLAKTLPTNPSSRTTTISSEKDRQQVAMVTSPLPEKSKDLAETTNSLGTGSSLGDVSTIVRGVFKRLRRERETLSASLETENSMREQSLKVLRVARQEPRSRHVRSAPSTQTFPRENCELRLSKSADTDLAELVDGDAVWQAGGAVVMATEEVAKIETKSTTDLEGDNSLDVNSNRVLKSAESCRPSPPRRRFCWMEKREGKESGHDVVQVQNDVIVGGNDVGNDVESTSDSSKEDEVQSDKSDDLNSLYQIYTDQLSTLNVRDDSSDDDDDDDLSSRPQSSALLAPIAEDNESEASSPIASENVRTLPKRSRTVSGSSAGSVDQSLVNLDRRMPGEPEAETLLVTSVSGNESEAEMTQLHDAYVDQLGQF